MAQNWQPMHLSLSICTVPSSVTCDAWVGHTFTHSGSSQCWHWMGRKYISTSGQSPEPPSLGVGPMRSVLIQKSGHNAVDGLAGDRAGQAAHATVQVGRWRSELITPHPMLGSPSKA